MIFAWAGSMPGEGGGRCDCHNIEPPISNGSRLKGKRFPES